MAVGARFEDFKSSAGFMDLHWPGVLIVEMKAPSKPLGAAREQVKRYWEESADSATDTPAARWVLLCNFHGFELWEPGRFPKSARTTFTLEELPDRHESLLFLAGPEQTPAFIEGNWALTTAAAQAVADVYRSLIDRAEDPPDEIRRFTMQTVWVLFAEDLNLLQGQPFQRTIERLRREPDRNPAAELGFLFRVLNQSSNRHRKDLLAGTHYVNGQLFADPAEIELDRHELDLLAQAAAYDWSKVDPTIFGSLMEGVLGRERRWELGAHYTHEADILKIVGPTIIRPWQQRIDASTTPAQARELLDELCSFRVLDPACGCGNFLYVAYRELRGLEAQLKQRISDLAASTGQPEPAKPWPYYPLTNLHGIDIEPIAVLIARVTLWMGHRQMIDRYGEAENPLPLVSLSNISVGDAVFGPWPTVDAIIGNPPFHGSQQLRRALGDDYVERLKDSFGVGVKDFCTYWFRRAEDHLTPGQRAGLVGTNSISQNRARSVSLDYIIQRGGVITDAVSSQKWPGDAKVHVSLVNWINAPYDGPFTLDGREATGIDSSLRASNATEWHAKTLPANKGYCFQGPIPVGAGFIISDDEAHSLLARTDADYAQVVRRYLDSDDIAEEPAQSARRWIIDFAMRPLEQAREFSAALDIVRDRVRPEREKNSDRSFRETWWRFGRPRGAMRQALSLLSRYGAVGRHGKRFAMAWVSCADIASDATCVFAFDDDFSMGVLQSRAHIAWAWHQSSTLKGDLRYTPTSVFMTFPWPDTASSEQRAAVAAAVRTMLDRRRSICQDQKIGLTQLYNQVDEGAYADLKRLHDALDRAVATCYGWPRSAAHDDSETVRLLLERNKEISTGQRPYQPFGKH